MKDIQKGFFNHTAYLLNAMQTTVLAVETKTTNLYPSI